MLGKFYRDKLKKNYLLCVFQFSRGEGEYGFLALPAHATELHVNNYKIAEGNNSKYIIKAVILCKTMIIAL